MYKSKDDIVNWLRNHAIVSNKEADLEAFLFELQDQVKQMNFHASNGGAAMAYSG